MMYTRAADSRIWSRPIILLPALFHGGDPAKRYNVYANGGQEKLPDTSESKSNPSTATTDTESNSVSNTFMASLQYFTQPSDMHMDSLFTAGDSSSATAKTKDRKKRGRSRTKNTVNSEDIPEYKGQMPVDDLVNFINSGASKKGSTKKKTVKTNTKTEPRRSSSGTNSVESSCRELEEMDEQGIGKVEVAKELISPQNCAETETDTSSATDSRTESSVFPTDSSYWEDFTIVSRKKRGKNNQQQTGDDDKVNNSVLVVGHTKQRGETSQFNNKVAPSQSTDKLLPSRVTKTTILKAEEAHSNIDNCNSLNSAINPRISNVRTKLGTQEKHEELRGERPDVLEMNGLCGIVMKSDNQYSAMDSMSSTIRECNHPVATFKGQRQPVVFVDGNNTKNAKIDVSFGFGVQDLDSGFESAGDVDFLLFDSCSCKAPVQHNLSATDSLASEGVGDSASATHHPNYTDTDENNNSNEQDARRYCDTEQIKSTPPTAALRDLEASQTKISREIKDKNDTDDSGIKIRNKRLDDCVDETVSIKGRDSTKEEFGKVLITNNRSTLTKKNSMSSTECNIGSLTNVKCNIHNVCAGRPVSIVAPNQPLSSFSSSGHKLISKLSRGNKTDRKSCGTTQQEYDHSQSPCTCVGPPSLGHNLCQSLNCSPTPGPCGQAPVLKVAPMLSESFGTTSQAIGDEDRSGEPIARKASIPNDKGDETERKHNSISREYHGNPRIENKTTETTVSADLTEEKRPTNEQTCSTKTVEKISHDCNQLNDKLQFPELQSHSFSSNQSVTLAADDEERFSSDAPVTQETIHRPLEDTFDLLSAQIFLYKTCEDFFSATHAVQRKVHATEYNE